VLPYVPAPFGNDLAGLPLSREYDTDIDPVTYQVLRWRLWNINVFRWEHTWPLIASWTPCSGCRTT
jgi:hypothetical protein